MAVDIDAADHNLVELGEARFSFERATRDDVPAIVAMLADDPLGTDREDAAGSPRYLAAFEAIDVDPGQLLVVVRDQGGNAVGTMQLTLLPGLSRGGATRLQIEAVRIDASVRGRHLGAAMIDWAHQLGRRHGARLAQLTTDKSRTEAHRFYARLGYQASHIGMKRTLD